MRRWQGPLPGLADYAKRAGSGASWEGYCSRGAGKRRHQELVRRLEDLQHGLCGYCEIDLRDGDREVEHVAPKSRYPACALSAGNVIACCRGGVSDDPDVQGDEERYFQSGASCGHAKGSEFCPEFVDPRDLPAAPSLTRVRRDGWIEADEDACRQAGRDADGVNDTIRLLGLNVERLLRARRSYWRNLNRQMRKYGGDARARKKWARSRLLPEDGRLAKFFTTSRSFFGGLAEAVLAEPPQDWI